MESNKLTIERGTIGFGIPYLRKKQYVSEAAAKDEFRKLSIEVGELHHLLEFDYENAEALSFEQPNTQLDEASVEFLQCLLNSYMILGIPSMRELNQARNILCFIDYIIKCKQEMEENFNTSSSMTHVVETLKLWHNPILEQYFNRLDTIIIASSNEFYQMIPHVGPGYYDNIRKGFRPPIETLSLCSVKHKIVNRLETVVQTIKQGIDAENVNPLDFFCNHFLQIQIISIPKGSPEFNKIIGGINIHSDDIPLLKNLFKVNKHTWNEEFRNDIDNQRFLFHTAKMDNMVDILKDGLEVAPDHVVSYNRWLGRGIYFFGNSKAVFNYANNVKRKIVLVCRVALGKQDIIEDRFHDRHTCDFTFQLNEGNNSLISPGKKYRSLFEWSTERKAFLPTSIEDTGNEASRYDSHDEFLIQSKNQCKIEYIIELH